MINNISSWAQGIVIAIIIGAVLQMVIPENKNKKYIKVVVGIYVLFSIINPVIGTSFNFDDFKIEQYMPINETNDDKSNPYEKNVKNMFQEKVKKSIKNVLNEGGYDSENIDVKTNDEYNIESVQIANVQYNKKGKSIISINKVDIGSGTSAEKEISIIDSLKIKKNIAESFGLEEKQVEIK